MRLKICFIAMALGGCAPPTPAGPPQAASKLLYPVLRVIDGDTLVVDSKAGELVIRLREVNTPERGECGAEEAKALLHRLSTGGVGLEPDGYDRNGRILAHAFTSNGTHIGVELVHAGLAHVASYGDPDEYLDRLRRAERSARQADAGLYGPKLSCAPPADAPIKLVDLDANPPGNDLGPQGESVTLTGRPGFSLEGWSIKDTSASHRYRFPAGSVMPETGEARVLTGVGADGAGVFYWGMKGSAVWNNDGDTAFLIAPGGAIVSWLDYRPKPSHPSPD